MKGTAIADGGVGASERFLGCVLLGVPLEPTGEVQIFLVEENDMVEWGGVQHSALVLPALLHCCTRHVNVN